MVKPVNSISVQTVHQETVLKPVTADVLVKRKTYATLIAVNGLWVRDVSVGNMSWGFRKSARLGPLKINFSKRGVSSSVGVKGARVSFTKKGAFLKLGSNGFYYRKKINSKTHQKSNPPPKMKKPMKRNARPLSGLSKLTDNESLQIVNELNLKTFRNPLFWGISIPLSCFVLIIVAVILYRPIHYKYEKESIFTIQKKRINIRQGPGTNFNIISKGLLLDKYRIIKADTISQWLEIALDSATHKKGYVLGTLGKVNDQNRLASVSYLFQNEKWKTYVLWVITLLLIILMNRFFYRRDQKRLNIHLFYQHSQEIDEFHQTFLDYFDELRKTQHIWEITNSTETESTRYNSGATQSIERIHLKDISLDRKPFSRFKTNVKVPFMHSGNYQYYFFPERLIIKQFDKYAGILYKNLNFNSANVRFIEEQEPASDAEVIDYVWKYTNKNGGKDKRFSDNRQLPICRYSEYKFSSNKGFELTLNTSKPEAMDKFITALQFIASYQKQLNFKDETT